MNKDLDKIDEIIRITEGTVGDAGPWLLSASTRDVG